MEDLSSRVLKAFDTTFAGTLSAGTVGPRSARYSQRRRPRRQDRTPGTRRRFRRHAAALLSLRVPRSPISVSRASCAAFASSSARRFVSMRSRAVSYAAGRLTRSAAPFCRRFRAARAKICCSVAVRSERLRPTKLTVQCSNAGPDS